MIELENVTKTYSMGKVEIQAIRGVSLTIEEGDMVAIMGASGSGKSTLMNVIGFLDNLTSGKYVFKGTDVSEFSDNQLAVMRNREIGFVTKSILCPYFIIVGDTINQPRILIF